MQEMLEFPTLAGRGTDILEVTVGSSDIPVLVACLPSEARSSALHFVQERTWVEDR